MTAGYEPRFDRDYERGRQGELWIDDLVTALTEGLGRVEVKTDYRALDTGNIYVEYECRRSGRYRPSGISTTEAEIWVVVLDPGRVAVIVSTDRLKALARSRFGRWTAEETDGSHPTRGVLVPLALALSPAIRKAVS